MTTDALLPVIGPLLYSTRAALGTAVDQALAAGVARLTIDLTQCTGIDSSGMGALVSAAKKAREHSCRIRLEGLDEDLRDVMQSTGLGTLFDWPDSPADSSGLDPQGERHG